jgi:hypothetical protein
MPEHTSLEGWTPDITDPAILADVVDKAFDYRGDVTIITRDGARRVGYVFNRRSDVAAPFIQMFPAAGGGPEHITYAEIQSIAFSGRDTAAGNSYAAWLKRKEAERTGPEASSDGSPSEGA